MDRRDFLLAAAAVPLGVRVRIGGSPVALVTADKESRIVVVDPRTGAVLRSIATHAGPRSIESVAGRTAVVAHTELGVVTLVDGPTLRVRHVLREFEEPRYTAAHPDGRHAFVTDSKSGDVVALDLADGRTLGRVRLDGPSRHVTLDPSGRTLWVGLGFSAERIGVVDVSDLTRPRLRVYVTPPFHAHDVGFAPGGRHVWVTSGDSGSLAVYDAREGRPLRRLPADEPPQHVTFLGGAAYIASGDSARVRVHSLRDGRILRTTAVPEGSYNIQQGWGMVLTPSLDRGTLAVLAEGGRLERRVRVARSSHDACFVVTA